MRNVSVAKYLLFAKAVANSAPSHYAVSTRLTNLTVTGDTAIDEGGTATVTLAAETGYVLPSTVTVTGATSTYDDTTGKVSLSSPTGDVLITAAGDVDGG